MAGDCADETPPLETICTIWAQKHIAEGKEEGNPRAHFLHALAVAQKEFNSPTFVRNNVENFLLDSYHYHRLYLEKDEEPSWEAAMSESYEYLLRIVNGLPLQYRPMRDEWRRNT